jgi:bifunctional pyridoxal-dependent enzyme with beta-cystathionase and maltose regulon repressor activities
MGMLPQCRWLYSGASLGLPPPVKLESPHMTYLSWCDVKPDKKKKKKKKKKKPEKKKTKKKKCLY